MPVRGINPFEKHFEKALLGLAAAGLLGVVAYQFVGSKPEIDLGAAGKVPAAGVWDRLTSQAQQLQSKMRNPTPELPELPKIDLLSNFRGQLTGSVTPAPTLAWVGDPVGLGNYGSSSAVIAKGQFVLPPVLPALPKPMVMSFLSTIDPSEVSANSELAKALPKAAPFDSASVSVEVAIDAAKLKAAFEADPDGEGPAQALSRSWWENTQAIGLRLVRQKQMADGSWGPEEVVATNPGRINLLARINERGENMTGEELSSFVAEALLNEEAILRPAFYKRHELWGMQVGEEWASPSARVEQERSGADEQLLAMRRRESRLQADVNRLRAELERLRNPGTGAGAPPGRNPGGGGGGGGRGGGGGGRGGGGGGSQPGGAPAPDPRQQQITALEARLAGVQGDLAKLRDDIRKKGGTTAPTVRPVGEQPSLLTQTNVQAWAHDFTAQRGGTYRYRAELVMNNPLFNRPGMVKEELKDAAKKPTIATSVGQWSDPIRVEDDLYYFITGGNRAGDPRNEQNINTSANARAEMFTFTMGYWRKAEASLEPGDAIAAEIAVPDVEAITRLSPPAPASGAGGPGADPGPGGGGGRRPGGGGGLGGGGGTPVALPPTPAPGGGPGGGGGGAEGAQATPARLPTRNIALTRDAFILDVVRQGVVSTATRENVLVLVRESDGAIVAKKPEEQRSEAKLAVLNKSAAEGLRLMETKNIVPTPADGQNPAENPANPSPAPLPGGGGGVGGRG